MYPKHLKVTFPIGLPGIRSPATNSVNTLRPIVVLLTAVMMPTGTRKTVAITIASTRAHIGVCNGVVFTSKTIVRPQSFPSSRFIRPTGCAEIEREKADIPARRDG